MKVISARVESVREARQWLDRFLRARAVSSAQREDARLVLSELVTNALVHGEDPPVVRAAFTESRLELSVTDAGDRLPTVLPVDPDRIGGFGLHVVDQLSTAWGVSPFPGGKTVWATLGLTG